jgi:hypothetical protein
MASIVCVTCGKFHGYCSEVEGTLEIERDAWADGSPVTQPDEEDDPNMIPRGNMAPQNARGRGTGTQRQQTGLDFLSIKDLSATKQLAKILAARTQPDTYKPGQPDLVAVKIQLPGKLRLWNLRTNNPNLEYLGDQLGDDETQWAGVELFLFNEVDEFDNKTWIRCEVASNAPAPKPEKTVIKK